MLHEAVKHVSLPTMHDHGIDHFTEWMSVLTKHFVSARYRDSDGQRHWEQSKVNLRNYIFDIESNLKTKNDLKTADNFIIQRILSILTRRAQYKQQDDLKVYHASPHKVIKIILTLSRANSFKYDLCSIF